MATSSDGARPMLLDTCAVIWIGTGAPVSAAALGAILEAAEAGRASYVSPISAWELGMLVSRGHLPTAVSERVLLDAVLASPAAAYADLPVSVLIDSSHLPGVPPSDPGDRILIATAREFGLCILTRDRKILDYAEKGHVMAMAC